ncbi:MAG: 4Fe-4S binding protein [bacterium]|nr:4Fe-4S binding protein [bacterium]
MFFLEEQSNRENEQTETSGTAVDLVKMAKTRQKEQRQERLAQTWGGKQLRRFRARSYVQMAMFGVVLAIGFQFYRFVHAGLTTTSGALPHRPPGVDGFLPITGIMGVVDWIATGTLNTIHPAATILLLVFVVISLFWRKAFCSWLCPVGTISEYLALMGRKIFGRNFRIWKWLDITMRGFKYFLLSFFLWAIVSMGAIGTNAFLYSDYNYVADVKMGMFFVRLGTVGAVVMGILIVGSIFVNGFWCRYFCPYGALVGLFSWMSPTKIKRTASACIDCELCNKACPARLPVMTKERIVSVECTGCFDCVASCPVPEALNVEVREKVSPVRRVAMGISIVFVGVWLLAQLTGVWSNSISDEEYRERIPKMDDVGHPGR